MVRKMSESRKSLYLFTLFIFFLCFTMAVLDLFIHPYPIKSIIKWILFFGIPLIYMKYRPAGIKRPNLKPEKKKIIIALGLGVIVYLFILSSYLIFQNVFDFSNIVNALSGEGIDKNNFLFVALYISFVNSLLEEFFFRVFIYHYIRQWISQGQAMFFSASAFALYHMAIMDSWFSPLLFTLLIISLLVAGYLFLWINDKTESFYTSWIVHMFANFSINTIGFILFGII